jgi:hypothetical protein
MQLDKQFVLDELKKEGQNEQVQKAVQELPDKIDHEQHAALLEKVGIDPGKLAAAAIQRGIGTPTGPQAGPLDPLATSGQN